MLAQNFARAKSCFSLEPPHAGDMLPRMHVPARLRHFLFPRLTPRFALRVLLFAALTWLIFTQILVPVRIHGISMEPTHLDGDVAFCWRWRYAFSPPNPGDIVAVRFAGPHAVLIKRVVGLPGDTVAFADGRLLRNGTPVAEPYVQEPCNWNLAPRRVEPGNLYVVGDNRSMDIQDHDFGQTDTHRIVGGIL